MTTGSAPKALGMMLLVVLLLSNFGAYNASNTSLKSKQDGNSSDKKNGKNQSHHQHHGNKGTSSSGKMKPLPSPIPSPEPSPTPMSSSTPRPTTSPVPSQKPHPAPSPSPKPSQTSSPVPSANLRKKAHQKPNPHASLSPSPEPSKKSHSKPKTQPSPTPIPAPQPSPKSKPQPSPSYPPAPHSNIFNVLDFGAKGDGITDDTKAFQAAWAEACMVKGSTVLVPSEATHLVGPISFNGYYCQPNIVFQLEGTIIAPTSSTAWGSGILQWIEFTKLKGITVQGRGTIEGQGAVWWSNSRLQSESINERELVGRMPHTKPTALRFYGSTGVTVTGITLQNSPQCHLKFDNCKGVEVYSINISSPGDSSNTDGIHLQNSQYVAIHHSQLSCGDDCISIQTGCSNINIHHVNCGPGHGISIGGLGPDNTKACVSNITVQNVALHGTMTGVRIKTWQGGSGSVQNVRFSNINVEEVQTPIMIDQYYCDRSSSCKNQSMAVAISGIFYENIKGTFTVKPIHLACSDGIPCTDISLTDIELQPLKTRYHLSDPFCWQTYAQLHAPMIPKIDCLRSGNPPKKQVQSLQESC